MLPPKYMKWKCLNFKLDQHIVHCDCGRITLTYQDMKSSSPYLCPCSFEFEYDVEIGVKKFKFIYFFVMLHTTIATFNVNGLNDALKRKSIFNYLKQKILM